MFPVFNRLPQPAILGHRGASWYAPENTLAAFDLALRQGADGIELDVQLTADRQVVVFHDRDLDRVTDGSGPVQRKTLAELRQLDAGQRFGPQFAGEKIPSLAEVLEIFGTTLFINIEIKYFDPLGPLPRLAAAAVRQYGDLDRVWISSFDPFTLWRIRRLLPEVPAGLLTPAGRGRGAAARLVYQALGLQAHHPNAADVSPEMVAAAHRCGRKVFAWTVDDLAELSRLAEAGVDGIITNDPLRACQTLRGAGQTALSS